MPVVFKFEIIGRENFPQKGPLVVVGNHSAVMEAVLMAVYSPWQVEMLGAADIPHEKITQIFSDAFGYIPIHRGQIDRPALQAALSVLEQGGVIGVFPEGGIWEPGSMRAQTGVSWLSFRGEAPVLPLGFSGALGALDQALHLKRPRLRMKVGKLIQPIEIKNGVPRKTIFESYAEQVLAGVRELLLPDDPSLGIKIKDEDFELKIELRDRNGKLREIPAELTIQHQKALAEFLHRPAILKIFKVNLNLPMDALQNLDAEQNPRPISEAVQAVLDYLNQENPYLLSYRFGPKNADAMKKGLEELLALAQWAAQQKLQLIITPLWKFYSVQEQKEIIQIKQGAFEHWM